MVNGSLIKEIAPKKGLRQEDPLAPFLFLIGLAGVVRQVESKGLIKGIMVGQNKISITMLQFVDDTIFVCKATTRNIMVSILRCFEIMFNLKVNLNKSALGSIDVIA